MYLQEKITATCECEVLDIDEEEYRNERINTRLFGYLSIPRERRFTQNRKCGTPISGRFNYC
jgi:predicted polyphosphate/ATP-dependent NAD kinase